MNKAETLEFINATKTCYLATVEGDQPHVRGIGICWADENGIVIQTWRIKDIYQQLNKNPNAELCFHNNSRNKQVRVSGRIEPVEDKKVIERVLAERKFLEPMMKKVGRDALYICILKHGKAFEWTMDTNFEPKKYTQL